MTSLMTSDALNLQPGMKKENVDTIYHDQKLDLRVRIKCYTI